jgi:hypothetical protein
LGVNLGSGQFEKKNPDNEIINIENSGGFQFQYEIGQYVEEEGGVIFYRYKEGDSQFYYVVSTVDLSTGHTWSNLTSSIGESAQSPSDGYLNSLAIISQSGHTESAAQLCFNYRGGGKDDWYLPAILELMLIQGNIFIINKTLNTIGGNFFGQMYTGDADIFSESYGYWSSCEGFQNQRTGLWNALNLELLFNNNSYGFTDKSIDLSVRPIRKFSLLI